MGQDGLFRALDVELDYIDLIRNILLMHWNMEVQPTSNYSLGWPYKSLLESGHADLIRDQSDKD